MGPGREREFVEACRQTLARGRSVILLVPDNATAAYWQTVMSGLDLYHSEIKTAAKESIWRQYRLGKSGVVCGGLSALMLPLANTGLLIVDRASSPLYQRGFASPFRLDHLAAIRAQTGRIPLLRGAASHSCASYWQRQDLDVTDGRLERGISCQVHMLKGRERGIPDDLLDMIRQNFLTRRRPWSWSTAFSRCCTCFAANAARSLPARVVVAFCKWRKRNWPPAAVARTARRR